MGKGEVICGSDGTFGLFSWNGPKGTLGTLDSSGVTRASVILHRYIHNIKQSGNEGREGVRSLAHMELGVTVFHEVKVGVI